MESAMKLKEVFQMQIFRQALLKCGILLRMKVWKFNLKRLQWEKRLQSLPTSTLWYQSQDLLIGSQYPVIRYLLGQGTPGCYLTNIRSSFFGWVYCFSRLIASRLELRASFPSFVNSLYLLCYVSRTFCSAVSWFCWQTTCKTDCYSQYGKRTEKQSSGHSFSSTSCYWNYQVLSEVSLRYVVITCLIMRSGQCNPWKYGFVSARVSKELRRTRVHNFARRRPVVLVDIVFCCFRLQIK